MCCSDTFCFIHCAFKLREEVFFSVVVLLTIVTSGAGEVTVSGQKFDFVSDLSVWTKDVLAYVKFVINRRHAEFFKHWFGVKSAKV